MSVKVENLEKNLAKLTVEVPVEKLEESIEKIYRRAKNQITLPGFRKGKAPRKMIEKYYGADGFLEDAVNDLVPEAYEEACRESGLEIVSEPELAYEQVEAKKPVIFTATVAVRPDVVLGEYKGLEVESQPVEVTEEEIEAELKREQEKNATMKTVDDRPVQDGDIIELSFEGFVDGTPFEGGKSDNYPLTIGSHSFIPGFEEQLIGAEIGKEKDVNVTFPEEYHAKELAGKPAVFKCTVKSIKVKELPELDDEFASEVSDFETLEEYKADIRKRLTENKERQAKIAKEDALVDKIIENSQMEIPDLMVTSQARNMVNEFGQRLQSQGLDLRTYMQYTGQDEEKMVEQMRDQALKRIQTRLVMEAIVKAENLTATEEDVEEEIKKLADGYGMDVDQVKTYMDDEQREQMKMNIAVQKAIDLVYAAAK